MTSASLPATVLIVEDDECIRNDLSIILQLEGFHTLLARNGHEALMILEHRPPPQVMVLDLMMPEMDGWQFRVEQLKSKKLAQVPIILLSAASSLDQEAATLGAVGYIEKPFNIADLLAMLKHYCDGPST
jgi:two-component system, chemotaxis family, chemotaxis protein CheY